LLASFYLSQDKQNDISEFANWLNQHSESSDQNWGKMIKLDMVKTLVVKE